MKWPISVVALAPLGFIAFMQFTFRQNRDSAFGTAYRPAYAAPDWALALAFALVAAAILFVIHGAKGRRWLKAVLLVTSFIPLALADRDLNYSYGHGGIIEGSLIPPVSARTELGASELICFDLTDFGVTVRNPDNGTSASYFRGIWPCAFTAEEMDRILTPC